MTIDLSNNRVPFGLLTEEEQEHLKNWEDGIEFWTGSCWTPVRQCHRATMTPYRTVSPPKRVERFWVWDAEGDSDVFFTLEEAMNELERHGGTIYRITRNDDGSDPQIEVVE